MQYNIMIDVNFFFQEDAGIGDLTVTGVQTCALPICMAAARARDCTTAVAAFEGVIRRQRAPAVQDAAREGISLCALIEGQRMLEAGKPADAESWFRRATAPRAPLEVTRGAFLGLGDVPVAHGHLPRALPSYPPAPV